MKNAYNGLLLLLMAAILAIISGCATTREEFGVTPRTQMTVAQARRALAQTLRQTHWRFGTRSVRDIRIKRDQATWVEVVDGTPFDHSMNFAIVKDFSVVELDSRGVINFFDGSKTLGGMNVMVSSDKATAVKFVDAVLTLKAAALMPGSDETDFAAFSEQAKVWLASTPRPEMPDEARTYKLLAEDAFKRQDLPATLEAYENALEIFPMWPQGHYNAALLAAETKDYGLAADHMRRYLVLAPNAADVRDAKDKLLLWQHKAKE